jgi:four helix bundle protein
MKNIIKSVRDLEVYRLAFDTAMEIYDISKGFPKEEKYSLTDQIRRSSRSVCTNIAEAWRKRKYKAMFISKITDSQQESAETQTWLEFAHKCGYINNSTFLRLDEKYEHIYAMLFTMEFKVDSFCKIRPSSFVLMSKANDRPS